MTSDINAVNKSPSLPNDDLVTRASRFGIAGWIAFFMTLIALILQNIIIALKPANVLAAENGVVIGQVMFDEARNRDIDIVMADLKIWVARCTSVNKLSIYEDLAVCLRHMNDELSEAKLLGYQNTSYGPYVENYGCQNTEVVFYDNKNLINREEAGNYIQATIAGEVLCLKPNEKPVSQEFSLRVAAKLVNKTSSNTLGFQVHEFEDVE